MNVCHLFRVAPLFCFAVEDFFEASFVEAIEQVDQRGDQQTEKGMSETLVQNCCVKEDGGSSAREFCRQCPDDCFGCRHEREFARFKTQKPRRCDRAQYILQRCEYE